MLNVNMNNPLFKRIIKVDITEFCKSLTVFYKPQDYWPVNTIEVILEYKSLLSGEAAKPHGVIVGGYDFSVIIRHVDGTPSRDKGMAPFKAFHAAMDDALKLGDYAMELASNGMSPDVMIETFLALQCGPATVNQPLEKGMTLVIASMGSFSNYGYVMNGCIYRDLEKAKASALRKQPDLHFEVREITPEEKVYWMYQIATANELIFSLEEAA
ncbi:hypothetical protein ACI2KR_06755 [Pseudomonas luteola]